MSSATAPQSVLALGVRRSLKRWNFCGGCGCGVWSLICLATTRPQASATRTGSISFVPSGANQVLGRSQPLPDAAAVGAAASACDKSQRWAEALRLLAGLCLPSLEADDLALN